MSIRRSHHANFRLGMHKVAFARISISRYCDNRCREYVKMLCLIPKVMPRLA
jgi:hypothetical protein